MSIQTFLYWVSLWLSGVETIRSSKKDALLDAAIRSYAESGEQGLTTKNLAKVAGCSEALIYRHFKSKDDLLRACFLRLHYRANDYLGSIELPENPSISEMVSISKAYWIKAFKFFIDAGQESLFFFWFRMSDYYLELLEQGAEDVTKARHISFMNMMEEMRVRFHLDISPDHYRTYIVFATGTFATQVLTGKLPATDESYDMMADLLIGGLMTTFPGYSLTKITKMNEQ